MTNKERVLLILSLVASITVWGFLYGIVIGTAFTLSLLFHEYGHYYWMGHEGIKSKTMVMIPPLGAIAKAKEPWPSLGAEARIALAGPGFGLVSAVALLLIGTTSGSYEIKIATFAACLVNLFNFWTPIAVLDGGRVVKSILFSFSSKLGFIFYHFSLITLIFLAGYFFSPVILIISFLISQVLDSDRFSMWDVVISNKLVKMSRREVVLSVFWFLILSAGLYATMTLNGIRYPDFVEFMTSK